MGMMQMFGNELICLVVFSEVIMIFSAIIVAAVLTQ